MSKYFAISLDACLAGQPSKEPEVEIYKIIAMFSKMHLYLWKHKD